MKKDYFNLRWRSRWLLVSLLAILAGASPAWGDDLTVHDGTESSYIVPIFGYRSDSYVKMEYILPATELSDMAGGSISGLTYYLKSSESSSYGNANFVVFLKEVSGTTISAFSGYANDDIVYQGSLDATGETLSIPFSKNYSYGGGNLLIGIYNTTKGTAGGWQVAYYYGTTATSGASGYSYSSQSMAQATYVYKQPFLPKTTFAYTASSCKPPKNLIISNITGESADLSWSKGDDADKNWQIVYSTDANFDKDSATPINVSSTSYSFTDLNPGTNYYVAVRTYGSDSEQSAWVSTDFKTEKVAVPATGFTDNFETNKGWDLINGTCPNKWVIGTGTNNGGSKSLYISQDGTSYASSSYGSSSLVYASMLLSFEAGDYTISYDWMCNGEGTYDFMRVGLVPASVELSASTSYSSLGSGSTLPTGWTMWLDGGSKLGGSKTWATKSVDFTIETAGNYQVVFAWRNDYSGGSTPAAIDNFSITVQTCPAPTNLTVTGIAARQATLNWATSDNTWEVYCTTEEGTPAANVEVTAADIATNSYTFTGLTPETKYYVWVRSVNGSDKSEWVGTNFTTDISCPVPTGLTLANITSTGATLSWTSDADNFNVRYKKVSDADWTLVEGTISAKTYTLTGLTPATAYQVQVRTYCDAADQSAWTDAENFTTDCAAIAEFPFSENFNSITAGIPDCWNNSEGTTNTINYRWSYYANGGHDGVCLRFNSYNNNKGLTNMLKTPVMNFPSGKTMQLTFWYKNPTGGDFSVYISNDGGTTYTKELATGLTGVSAWTQKEIVLPADFTENVVIVFKGTSNYGNGDAYIYLDDVTIDEAPACVKPTALAASNVTASSVELSWTNGSNEEAWQIAYGTAADFDANAVTPVEVTTNPFTLTGLSAETTYYVCIRAKKGADVSDWSDKVSFTTEASCITPTDFAVSATTINSATLTWTDATEQSKWEVSYSTTSGAPEEGTIVAVTEKTYTIEGLTAGTTYYASVRAVNSDDDKSAWSSEVSFVPGVVIANEGTTTNYYVPLYGNYADAANGTQSQFIVPATNLTSVAGKQIDKIAFYCSIANKSWGNAEFEVYVKAVDYTTFDSTTPSWDGMEKVYNGKLSVADGLMIIPFAEPFAYSEGNLMIGIKQTVKGSDYGVYWYGVTTTENTAIDGYNKQYRQFLPKTAFYYSPLVIAPKMDVSETELAYGLVAPNSVQTKTFTIENKGKADLTGITVSSNNAAFTVTEVQNQTIAVGGEAITVTVTLNTEVAGEYEGTVTVSATDQEDAVIAVSGTVRDANKIFIDFAENPMPSTWSMASGWSVSNEMAYNSGTEANITSGEVVVAEGGENIFFDYMGANTWGETYDYVKVYYATTGNGSEADWTLIDGAIFSCADNTTPHQAKVNIPAVAKYIRLQGKYIYIDNFYGLSEALVPIMTVTQPASLDFGVITEATPKTFTIANTGLAELTGINVTSSNDVFTVTGAPTTLAAGASAEVTITMATTTTGALSSNITVSATDMENVEFTVTGIVLPEGLYVEDFNEGKPEKWSNSGNYWTFNNGLATAKSSLSQLITPRLDFADGDMVVIKAQCTDNDKNDWIQILGSDDNGSTWTAYDKKIYGGSGLSFYKDGWGTIVLTDIPATVNHLKFVGYYVNIDEIAGLTYAPVLEVYKEGQGFATPAYHHFGECSADADVIFNFSNYGGGTITITNVAITGEGAAAYSTNWTKSVDVPFDLKITRTYNAERTGVSEAVITVTTTEGDFVINVDGSDKGLNAPELTVSPAVDADFGTQLQEAPKAQLYTITNTGTGTLTGTITSDNTSDFTVNASSFSLGAGESMVFEIALVYDDNYGAKSATITIHPTNEGMKDVIINATASTLDPEAWMENFAAGSLPTGWTSNNWTVGTFSSYENETTMAIAPSGSTAGTLITPRLTAKAGDVLTWDGYFNWYDEAMTVEYSADEQQTWTKIYDAYKAQSDFGSTRYTHKAMSFTAPADGDYYLRFTSTYRNGVDNFCGFKLNLPEHIVAITASNIPTSMISSPTMKVSKSFDATVTVKESRGVEEALTAKVYMGSEVVGSTTGTVAANGEQTLTITCTPTTSGYFATHIEVEYAGGTLTTTNTYRQVAELVTLALTETEEKEITTGYSAVYDLVTLTRSFNYNWNTFVAPVAVTLSDIHADAKAYEFTEYADGALNFTQVTTGTLNAATPYIIYVPEAISDKVFTWDNPVIYSSYVGEDNIKVTKNDAVFQGTYAPVAAGTLDGKYGVTSAAKIGRGNATTTMKGFRAYISLPDGANARLTFIHDDGTTTTISAVELDQQTSSDAYNLKGQRVETMKKGNLYIINGKKTIRK